MKTKLISKTLSIFAVLSMATLMTGCFDKTPPLSPTLSDVVESTSKNSVDVSIKGENGSKIFVNGKDSGTKLKDGKNSFTLDLAGEDGEKSFDFLLQDEAGNKSQVVNVKILKDTTAPKIPVISTASLVSKKDKFEIELIGEAGSEIIINGKKTTHKIDKDGKAKLILDTSGKDGEKSFTILAVDKVDNKSKAVDVKVIKDATAPKVPTLLTTVLVSKKDKFEVSISGEAGSNIVVNGKKISKTIDKNGKALVSLDTSGKDENKAFKILLEDKYANVGKELNFIIIKDANAPKVPTLKTLNQKFSNNIELDISAEDGSEIFMDKKSVGTIKNGKLKLVFDLEGADGEKNINFTAKDKAGNLSQLSSIKLLKDTKPFAIPTVSYKSLTNKVTGKVMISAEKGSSIILDGDKRKPLTLGKDNTLKLDLKLKDKDGLNTVEIASIDSYGNMSKAVKVNITKDATAPKAVILKNVATKTNKNTESVSILGEAGAELFINDKKTLVMPKDGKILLKLDTSGKDGKKEFKFLLKDKATNSSKETKLTITKDATPPKAPTTSAKLSKYTNKSLIEIDLTGEKDSLILLSGKKVGQIDKDGKGSVKLKLDGKDGKRNFDIALQDSFLNTSKSLSLDLTKDTIAPKNPTILNTPKSSQKDFIYSKVNGELGSSVILNGEDTELKLNSNGEVTVKLNISGLDGDRNYDFQLKDFAGNIGKATKVTINKDVISPSMPIISEVPSFTNKSEVDIKINGEIGSRIFLDGKDSNLTLKKDLVFTLQLGEDGEKNIEIALADETINLSDSKKIKIIKDTVAPKKPILSNNPKTTKNDSSYITLNGEAGSKIFINGKDSKISVNSSGSMQIPLNTSGLDGDIEFKIKLVDKAGNSSKSESIIIKKDIKAPGKPILSSIPKVISTDNNEIMVSGEKGARVFVNGEDLKMIINSAGKVKIPLNTSGKDGDKLYEVTLVDGAGNIGEAAKVTIAKDTISPKMVKITLPSLITSVDKMKVTINGGVGNTLFANNSKIGVFKTTKIDALLDLSGKDGKKVFDFSQKDNVGNESPVVTSEIIKDTISPKTPTATDYLTLTNKDKTDVLIETKESGTLIINGKEFATNGKLKTVLDLAGKDGKKSFNISMKDKAQNISKTLKLEIFKDATPPKAPTAPEVIKSTSNDIESVKIKGEAGSLVFINGYNSKMLLNSKGEANITLGTSGVDGEKTFKITLKDNLKNESKALNLKILKKSK